MLFKDFLFTFKNIHISFFEKKKIIKLIRVGLSIIYKFLILELLIYNFFYKKNLDNVAQIITNKIYIQYFNSFRQEHSYAKLYQDNFVEIKNKNLDILEIGLAKGDGVASFYFYFPNSNLIGVDNNPFRIRYKSDRIRNIYADISSSRILKNLNNHLKKKFDLIIEDCSHRLIDQILFFSLNFKNLKKGGTYIVEDLNFPEIHEMYNPTKENLDLKKILKKIDKNENFVSKFLNNEELNYIKNNIESIKFYKCKNKKNYLIAGICDYSEIAFIKKK